jgi:hypothetical protein
MLRSGVSYYADSRIMPGTLQLQYPVATSLRPPLDTNNATSVDRYNLISLISLLFGSRLRYSSCWDTNPVHLLFYMGINTLSLHRLLQHRSIPSSSLSLLYHAQQFSYGSRNLENLQHSSGIRCSPPIFINILTISNASFSVQMATKSPFF